jgi:membrane-associated PAP2 superfamily phosphatase
MNAQLFLKALRRRRGWLVAFFMAAAALWLAFDRLRLDLPLTAWLHGSDQDPFPLQHAWPAVLLNEWLIPGLAWLAGSALVVAWWRTWRGGRGMARRVALYLLLSLALGPGLLVNGVLKPHWGRPRPAEVQQFGGQREFRTPLAADPVGLAARGSNGRSFPSGHAAMGFWTTSAFFVARLLLPALAPWALAATLSFGLLAGAARVVAGRHFLSDILWAGLLVFVLNALLAWWLLHRHQHRQHDPTSGAEGKALDPSQLPSRDP